MNLFSVVLIGIFLLVGCSVQSNYGSSSREMLSTEYFKPNLGLVKTWKPLGKNHENEPSEHEKEQIALSLEICIEHLSSKYPNPPKESVRGIQIVECMKTKGWGFEIEEVLIMK